jgi:ankyrin repeat protein
MKHMLLSLLALAVQASASAAPQAALPTAPQVAQQIKTYYFDAARSGNTSMLREFSAAGYDLNTRDEKGYTALILAAYHGQAAAVKLLLDAGADPCAEDKRGNTALMGAILRSRGAWWRQSASRTSATTRARRRQCTRRCSSAPKS